MNKTAIRWKLIYFACLLGVCFSLVLIANYGFMQTVDIDVMLGIHVNYTGTSGQASVSATAKSDDLNQRIQEFMKTVTYTITPDSDLSNGDVIRVTASWDASLAAEYHFHPINTSADFVVEGLPQRVYAADLSQEFISQSQQAAASYLKAFLTREGSERQFRLTPVYAAFLRSDSQSDSDRILWIYRVNEGTLPSIWYMVLIPDVDDQETVSSDRIYAQRAYFSETEVRQADYAGFAQRIFDGDYELENLSWQQEPVSQPEAAGTPAETNPTETAPQDQ